MSPNEKELNSH